MEIQEIKSKFSLAEVVKHYGLTPNRNNLLKCPFHEDDTPSLQLYPKTNTWHCFGCNKGTDQMDFIRYKENCTPHEAIMKAKSMLNHQPMSSTATATATTPPLTQQERINALTTAFTYFARSLQSRDEEPRNYLKKRSLDWNKITVGYDGHNFHKSKEVTEELRKLYLSTGLIYPDKLGRVNNYHSFFDGCIVFPIVDEQEKIVNLYGRHIERDEHRYLPGEHQGIYPHYPKATTEILIITEAIIDCATLLQLPEITNKYELMSLYGTNNFKSEHEKAIAKLHDLKEVILFYDGDKAGRDAIEKHAVRIKELNSKTCTERPVLSGAEGSRTIRISYVETPDNEDINGLAQGHAPEIFTELINNRKSITGKTNFFPSIAGDKLSPEKEINTGNGQPINGTVANDIMANDTVTGNLDTHNPDNITYETDQLLITLWGGVDLWNIKRLRATLHLQRKDNAYLSYRETADLYSDGQTQKLIRDASERLETGTGILTKTITALTRALEQYRQNEREKERKKEEEERNRGKEIFSKGEIEGGLQFLRNKDLMKKTWEHINNIGLVGEEKNGMLLFFIMLTRMFKEPLHALVQGKSGSGKTYLLKKIAGLLPKKQIHVITALTENTLYHSLKNFWKHTVLLIEDLDGALSALLPLREMMTNQSISKLSTEKDMKTGEFKQMLLYVEGPVCVAGATTKDKVYEDNANRSFLIQVNESAEHQGKVLDFQRKEIAGLWNRSEEEKIIREIKSAQLHLESVAVVIPFGDELKIPPHVFKKLRTNAHYLTLIKAIAFWNQKQRRVKQNPDGTKYIEATLNDVGWANFLSKEVLLRKSDELDGQLRNFFEGLKSGMKGNKSESFFAKSIREKMRMNPMQVNRYLKELDQRGYIKFSGGNRKTGYEYVVLLWDDYEQLKSGMNIMDQVLEKMKSKFNATNHEKKASITEV